MGPSPPRGKAPSSSPTSEAPSLQTSHLLCLKGLGSSLWMFDRQFPWPGAPSAGQLHPIPQCPITEGLFCVCIFPITDPSSQLGHPGLSFLLPGQLSPRIVESWAFSCLLFRPLWPLLCSPGLSSSPTMFWDLQSTFHALHCLSVNSIYSSPALNPSVTPQDPRVKAKLLNIAHEALCDLAFACLSSTSHSNQIK